MNEVDGIKMSTGLRSGGIDLHTLGAGYKIPWPGGCPTRDKAAEKTLQRP
jgi:hypothetical protein